ncbi:Clp protease ClpP (plasmid) [Bacillus carboniphilus]|uniref:ATP-dependent Clp protease proteolytic subunit n=1 Tax=Bacillus carboniphilus TaxID=86663 RepID=A0ABY9K0D7_9BACI|nr:head maturation protease, ClpP-related [Bacillus carboniphilus]WLR44474.1 Clp protease ClpP [Bacillus carboniphilus]
MIKRFKNERYNEIANQIKPQFKAEEKYKENNTEITIYGDIGESWFGEAVTAKQINETLKNIDTERITIHLNSPGGDAFEGIAIYNQLKDHDAKVTVYVDGLAASIASIIAMAADELIMNKGSMLMIHEASTYAWGTKHDIQKTLNALEGIDKSLSDIYMTRYQGERSEIETMITNETWFTSEEAVEVGLADKVNEVEVEEENEEVDPEEFKNNILKRFRSQKEPVPMVASSKSILDNFRRNEN